MDEPAKDDDKSLLEEARANYKAAKEWWGDNQKAWLEDAKFRALQQWPEDIRRKREAEGLPCLTFDKLNQYIKQVVNDGRQNRPAIKVRPVDDGADIEAAEGIQGLVRQICNRSKADTAFDTALDHAAGNGFGFMRLVTEYAHENTFHQELAVRRIRNPLAVLLGRHEEADGSDAPYGFIETDIPKKEYKKKYPKAKETDWDKSEYSEGWSDKDTVKVCEYYYKVEEPRTLHLLATGDAVTDEEYQRALKELGSAPPIVESREIPVTRVKWCRLSGAEILEKKDWVGKYIPIFPVYGDESDIEGKVTYKGMIRSGRDPQMLHNFSRSAFAQRVAMTPQAPWLIAEGQAEGYEEMWQNANKGTVGALFYKAIDINGTPVAPPSRISPTDVPSGFAQDLQMSEHDIQGALGMYNAALGEKSNEKSGRAINARMRESDTATFHYPDNLNRSIRHLGRAIVDAAPAVYDGTRMVRLLAEDGTTTEAQIDPRQEVAYKKIQKDGKSHAIYNLNVGVYDVDISAGPSYTTKRQESADAMIELTRANPTMWQTHGDLIVGAQDWPNAQEFAKRSKQLLPPQVQQEEGDLSPDAMAIKAQATQVIQQKDEQIQAAEAGIAERDEALKKAEQENDALKSDRALNAQKLELEMAKAYNERLKLEAEANQQPVDTTALEFAKIENDYAKAKLAAEKDIIVAAMGKQQAENTAAIGAQAAADEAQRNEMNEAQQQPEVPQVDVAAALVAALQGFQEAMSRPRTIVRGPDGRATGIQ